MTAAGVARLTGRMLVGGLLIVFGLVFLLDNFGVLEADSILQFWPLILIGVGLWKAMLPREEGQRVFGVALVVVGMFVQLRALGVIEWRIRVIWPVILIAIGGMLLWRAIGRRRGPPTSSSTASDLSEFAFMGGGNRIIDSPDFRGGDVTAIMGGLEIDLRKATIRQESAVIDVFALWGGIELRIPPEWSVDVKGVALLGALENTARASAVGSGPGPRLVVRGTALMGGVEIKN